MTGSARPTLTRVDRDGSIPASYTQQERLRCGRGVIRAPNTTVALGLHLAGPLDTVALERAVGMLVQRHETLRLTFPQGPDGYRLGVTDGQAIGLRRYSAEHKAAEHRTAYALDLLAEAAMEPFDLAAGPLFRPMLVRLSSTEHILGLFLDKILVDRNSCVILQQDLLALYNKAVGQAGAGLPDLPLQFADYAAWEQTYLRGSTLDRLVGYWRRTLDGVDAIPDIGLIDPASDHGRPPGLAFRTRSISTELRERLAADARAEGVSLFTLLAGVLKAVIYTRRRPVMDEHAAADLAVFGSVANRSHRALRDIVGYLATYTVFRTDLSGDPTLAELVRRESGTVFGALCHQEIPHAVITPAVSPNQYGILHRIGQVDVPHFLHFDMDLDWASTLLQPAMLRVRPVRIPVREIPRGWLRLIARPTPDGLWLQLRFRTDFYRAAWVETFLADYAELLRQWPGRSGSRLSTLRQG